MSLLLTLLLLLSPPPPRPLLLLEVCTILGVDNDEGVATLGDDKETAAVVPLGVGRGGFGGINFNISIMATVIRATLFLINFVLLGYNWNRYSIEVGNSDNSLYD